MHDDLSTTGIYTQFSIEKLREIHAVTHPASRERVKNPAETILNAEATRPTALAKEAETEKSDMLKTPIPTETVMMMSTASLKQTAHQIIAAARGLV
jgi:hypothetical protein